MNVLSPQVEAIVESGEFATIDLIRFDLPGKTVGYHRGGRPFTYNGLKYLPNRFLEAGDINSAVGVAVTTRTIVFSNIPVTNESRDKQSQDSPSGKDVIYLIRRNSVDFAIYVLRSLC